jgi:ornithine cyclodeaminase
MSRKMEFLYLQQEDCIKAGGLDMKGTFKATARSFFLHGKGDYIMPEKPVVRWGGPETEETIGRIMSMPSWLGGLDYAEELKARDMIGPVNAPGIKYIPSRPHNPQKYDLPRANAIIIINNMETLMPDCIMDGTLVSAMRTGAASGVAAQFLANPDSKVMGLVGASVQGQTQTLALKLGAPKLEICKVYDINPKMCETFAAKMKDQVDMEIKIVNSHEEAIRDSDIISTATIASEPYINGEWYKEGAFHVEISFWDTPLEALKYMDMIVVDDWFQVKHHGADVSWRAVRDGIIPESHILGNLGEIVVGDKLGREDRKQKILFNPIGLGIHDLSEAHRIFQNAVAQGIGKKLPLWFEPALG